jgi:tetratricopeptide (TPR) repeat protein
MKTNWSNYLNMAKVNKNILLQRAETEFLEGDFTNALRDYGLLLKDYPSMDEAKVGVYLSDLGIESSEEAQALFDYYQVIKDEKENAVEIIDSLIRSLDNSKDTLKELFLDPIEEQIEYSEGIRYSDFLKLVESRGSFKKAFEDIMFSTKVVITNKDEFIDFVTKLTEEGFDEMALSYLDASSSLFGNDQDVLALYNVIAGMKK